MRRALWLAALIGLGSGPARAEPPWHPVREDALRTLFAEQELGDGAHYAYQFHRGGILTGTDMGRSVHGTWQAAGRLLCWSWSQATVSEECHEVKRRGQDVRLYRDGYEALSGRLAPISPPASTQQQR